MHAFLQPGFQPAGIFLQFNGPGDAQVVESKISGKLTDQLSMVLPEIQCLYFIFQVKPVHDPMCSRSQDDPEIGDEYHSAE